MANFIQQVVSGLASGGIYGSLALALVLIHRSTGVLNFAQGELATLSAFICWSLMDHGWSFWPAFGVTIALSFVGGALIQQILIRPIQDGPVLGVVILTIGLLIAVNGLMTWIWGGAAKQFDGPFSTAPITVGGVAFSKQDIGVIVISLVSVLLIWLLFARTKLGLGPARRRRQPGRGATDGRARADDARGRLGARGSARRGRRRAGRAVALPRAEHDADGAAVRLRSGGARRDGFADRRGVGGLVLGVLLNLVGTYVHWVGGELRLAVALAVILGVLIVRPAGLFGHAAVRRV